MMIDDETKEHLVPMSYLRRNGIRMTDEAWSLNILPVCRPCNQDKADMSPIEWLSAMPSNWHAYKLARHMVMMRFDMAEVFKALRERAR